ncbi:MAG: Rid family detoxifying hydrolase [Sporolactobacillus sp.]
MKRAIDCAACAPAAGPYVQGLVYENLIFSSQIGIDRNGNLVEGGITTQTKQIMENFREILNCEGLSLDDIIQCTIYIVDMNDAAPMNDVYSSYFSKPYPSRCCVAVQKMADGARVEMQIIAAGHHLS